jgi:hypothetical protein
VLAAIEDNLYPEQMSTISTCGLNFYITRDGALTVIDKDSMSGDYFRCADCGFENRISLYVYPTLYASYDGKAKYPVKAYKKMLNLVYSARVYQYSELNFGTFMGGWYYQTTGEGITKFIMYCPNKTIHAIVNYIPKVKIDDKVTVCFVTRNNEVILINSDCEIIETVCVLESEPGIFEMSGGYLECIGDIVDEPQNLIWSYKANKALNTKSAAADQTFD